MSIQSEIIYKSELEEEKEKVIKHVYEIFKDMGLIIGTPTGDCYTSSITCIGTGVTPNIKAGIFEHYENGWSAKVTPDYFVFNYNGTPIKMQEFLDYYEEHLKKKNLIESQKLEDLKKDIYCRVSSHKQKDDLYRIKEKEQRSRKTS